MNKPKIFVLLPVFNRLSFTKKCLSSIYKQTYKNYEVILIDDGSTDGTYEYASGKYPNLTVIRGDGNWWWTRCMFEGSKKALKTAKNTDFILEMNNDCYFDKHYFNNLMSDARKYPNTVIGSINVRSENPSEVVESGIRIDWPTGLVYGVAQTISNKLGYYKKMQKVDDLDALPGKGTLIPTYVFKKIGNFDFKKLPHYIADYEFAARAKRSGFNLIVSTKCVIKHHWEATGISSNNPIETISYKRAWDLLFGRRSMNNIIDWVTFVSLVCPSEHKIRNYYYSSLKIIKAVLSIYPFYYLRPLIKFAVRIYHHTKLFGYRTYLKIKQFPEYHLKSKLP